MSTNNLIIPDDYKDFIYRATYFILGKLAPYVPVAIRPNQITVMAFFSAIIGSVLLCCVPTPAAYLYWFLFNLVWYILDALDGIHARLTQQTSEYGAFLDHALDNLYFVAMFTAFTIKFDLAHVLYIYIILLRFTAATLVFIVQCHTKRLYLTRFSGGTELLLMSAVMWLCYFFPHYNPLLLTTNPLWHSLIHFLDLQQGFFMKVSLLFYAVSIPITFVLQFRFVQRECV